MGLKLTSGSIRAAVTKSRIIAIHAGGRRALNLSSAACFFAGVARAARLGGGIVALTLRDDIAALQHRTEVIMMRSEEVRGCDRSQEHGESESFGIHAGRSSGIG